MFKYEEMGKENYNISILNLDRNFFSKIFNFQSFPLILQR